MNALELYEKYAQESYQNSFDHGFWEGGETRSKGEMVKLMIGETSEAVEAHRKGWFHSTVSITTKPDDFEEWREVEGYEGEYEVSNLGDVRSLDMAVWGGRVYYSKTGRLLSPGIGGTGYRTVSLRGTTHKVAVLVARGFCEGSGDVVNHINGVKTDDYANNLEWCSYKENNEHAFNTGLKSREKILTYEQTIDIALRTKGKESHKSIYLDYPQISLSRIKAISREKERWTDSVEFELADVAIRIMDYVEGWRCHFLPRDYRKESTGNFSHDLLRIDWCILQAFHDDIPGRDWGYALAAVCNFGETWDIDLEWHCEQKQRFNRTRPVKHGKLY